LRTSFIVDLIIIIMLFTLSLFSVFASTHPGLCDAVANNEIPDVSAKTSPVSVSLWPMPASMTVTRDSQPVNADLFHFKATARSCDIMEAAFVRYIGIIFHGKPGKRNTDQSLLFKSKTSDGGLTSLDVELHNECEKWPSLEMDESCELSELFVTILERHVQC